MKKLHIVLLVCAVALCLTACSVGPEAPEAIHIEGDSESEALEPIEKLLPPAFPENSSSQQASTNVADEGNELVGLWYAMNTASSDGYAERWYFSSNGEFVRMASQLTNTPVYELYQYGTWGYWGVDLWLNIHGHIRADSEFTVLDDGREVIFDANFMEIPYLSPVVATHSVATGPADAAGRATIQIDGVTFYDFTDSPKLMADYEEIRRKVRGCAELRQHSDVAAENDQASWQGSGVLEMGCTRQWADGFPEDPLGSFYYIVVSPEDYAFYTGLRPGDYPPDRILAIQLIAADSTGKSLGDYVGELITFTGEYYEAQTAHHRCAALVDVTQLTLVYDAGRYASDPLEGLGKTLGEIRAEVPCLSYAGVVEFSYESIGQTYAPPGDRTLRYLIVPNQSMAVPDDLVNDFSRVGEILVCGIEGRWGQIYPAAEITSPKDIEAFFETELEAGLYNGSDVVAYDIWSLSHNGLNYTFRVESGEAWGPSTRVAVLLPVEQWDRQRQFAILEALN